MVGGSNGMLPVKHLASKIMTVNYCGRQLARWVGWAAPAYHKKEGATQHPVACKLCLLNDGRPDKCFGVQHGILVG